MNDSIKSFLVFLLILIIFVGGIIFITFEADKKGKLQCTEQCEEINTDYYTYSSGDCWCVSKTNDKPFEIPLKRG